ncbi:hypothetical protein IEO21_05404 [Rhodonia placenta]|uniref:SEC7 domain-containing protein n=1 Tax=Rhodonia placenta TaxID=104341 RepID=A0A8H7U1J7_9APHY|nr:hypothetical protein IEO21_05404 [Postia placenta]
MLSGTPVEPILQSPFTGSTPTLFIVRAGRNMEPSSVAEQRATAVAKLKRAASLPRMKDGRRPPMHVEAVSEGERMDHDDGIDEESVQDADGLQEGEEVQEEEAHQVPGVDTPEDTEERPEQIEEASTPAPETPGPAENIPTRAKRRSRSRTRSRGSKDFKGKAKQSSQVSSASHTNESSADEYAMPASGDEPPPSPPLVSPIPSHFALSASRLLASPFFYPGTTPPTPLPTLDDLQRGMTGMGLYRSNSAGAARMMAMHKLTGGTEMIDPAPSIDYEKPMGHRGVVVEEEDDVTPERVSPQRLPLPSPSTPARGFMTTAGLRLPHTSDAPSSTSTDSASVSVPVFISQKVGYGQEMFPASPFATPLKERMYPDEDEERVLVRSRSRLAAFERESEISWVAEPVPERERMPLHDDEDDEDELEPEEEPIEEQPQTTIGDRVPPLSELIVEVETSPEPMSAHILPSPISPIVPLTSTPSESHSGPAQPSPTVYPARLSVATPSQMDRSPSSTDFPPDLDDSRATVTEATLKRVGESTRTWGDKVKNAFPFQLGRSGSVSGRRSRTGSISIRDRRENTDSSMSRESHGSISREKGEQPNHETQPPSASTSILSLPIAPQMGMHSPIPPATAEMISYDHEYNPKLFPFPGIKQLEAQRMHRVAQSVSTPDVTNGNPMESVPSSSSSNTAGRSLEPGRERKLSHQASDSRLLPRFKNATSPLPVSSVPSSASQGDYFSIPSTTTPGTSASGSVKLPMNREDVKKWLNVKRKLFGSSPAPTPSATVDARPRMGDKKPSLSDILRGRKEADWEDSGHDNARTPTSPPSNAIFAPLRREELKTAVHMETEVVLSHDSSPETIHSPKREFHLEGRSNGVISPSHASEFSVSFPSPHDPPSSTTPDPHSSLDDFPPSTSDSCSMSSSHQSPDPRENEVSVSSIILARLDEVLGRGSKSSIYPNTLDDPPRKLVLSSPVLQVVNANTVKDRFLFLFNDILVIAKPVMHDQDILIETMKPSPLDRKFIVKSVCPLRQLRFSGERDEGHTKSINGANPMKHPVISSFVHYFAKDPDSAIAFLSTKTSAREDPIALGQLLFRTLGLDRARLGEYLSRRTSKVVLKAFINSYSLTGLRIDKALRVFLQAVHLPVRSGNQTGALEYLMDSFASRWHEANAGIVAYDKDLAVRLVRAIAQLNEVMHGEITDEPGPTGYPKRNVISRDFVEAFRRYDPRGLVLDDLLDKIYASIRRERLSQARDPSASGDTPDVPITIKRPLPTRLTYRIQSEPIILRIPQPDPHLTIQLFGQDLVFDPPVLSFVRSSETSFRVTGTSLGPKTIIMWRSGPNGILYTGLPLSSAVMVERAFMRNTFQLAFVNHNGAKRKYMFGVDDSLVRHQWAVSLKRQIDIASTSISPAEASGSSSQKAAESLALRVLQDTLISSEDDYPSVPLSPVDEALARLNGATPPRRAYSSSVSSPRSAMNRSANGSSGARRQPNGSSPHVRSKSRSQVYHRHGPGRLELELNDLGDRSDEDRLQHDSSAQSQQQQQQRTWSGRDLEIICRQNSLITPMLTYLQVGRRDPDIINGAVS